MERLKVGLLGVIAACAVAQTLGSGWIAVAVAQDVPAPAVKCERTEHSFRQNGDWTRVADDDRTNTEAMLQRQFGEGYVRVVLWQSYLVSQIAGEDHYVGYICVARTLDGDRNGAPAAPPG
jgi:hypothetical protein